MTLYNHFSSKDWFDSLGFRGCAFVNAFVELADAQHAASQFSANRDGSTLAQLWIVIRDDGMIMGRAFFCRAAIESRMTPS